MALDSVVDWLWPTVLCLALVYFGRPLVRRQHAQPLPEKSWQWYLPLAELLPPEIDIESLDVVACRDAAQKRLDERLARRCRVPVTLTVTALTRPSIGRCSYTRFPSSLYKLCDELVFDLQTDHEWLKFKPQLYDRQSVGQP